MFNNKKALFKNFKFSPQPLPEFPVYKKLKNPFVAQKKKMHYFFKQLSKLNLPLLIMVRYREPKCLIFKKFHFQ